MKIKIISWNIWFDSTDFPSICEFLKKNPADIIGLQEVSDDPKLDVLSFMKSQGYNCVFSLSATANEKGRRYGKAIFSKNPISNKQDIILSKEKSRDAIGTDVSIGNQILHVYNTHLIHDHQQSTDLQKEQVENLIKALPTKKTIVMGDFNAIPSSFVIKKMSEKFVNTDPSFEPTWTLDPAGCRGCIYNGLDTRLDYIFTSPDLKISSPRVEQAKGSDHLPISICIEI